MKLGLAIKDVHGAETELARELLRIGERHKVDHDVYHLTRTLATKAEERIKSLESHAKRHGANVDEYDSGEGGVSLSALREKGSELVGRRPETGVLLLRDLRKLHLLAAEASINWTMLGQGAQAARDTDLLDTVSACHPETLRALRWTTTKIKEAAPQVLTS